MYIYKKKLRTKGRTTVVRRVIFDDDNVIVRSQKILTMEMELKKYVLLEINYLPDYANAQRTYLVIVFFILL